jgi:acyl carrier protein
MPGPPRAQGIIQIQRPMPDDISQRVLEILLRKKTVDRATIGPETTLTSLGIDSLEGLEVIFALEDHFNIKISDDAAANMKTVGQVLDGVQRLVNT